MLELVRETGDVPSPEAVAERAQVSRRSVFRLFRDIDTLIAAATALQRAEVMRRFAPPPGPKGDLEDRVAAVVNHRAALYEFIMPLRRVAERRRHDRPLLDRNLRQTAKTLRLHLELLFHDGLPTDAGGRADVLDALELASSWSAWRTLRDDQGLSVTAAKRVVARLLGGLLGQR